MESAILYRSPHGGLCAWARWGSSEQGFAGGRGVQTVLLDNRISVDTLIDMGQVYSWDEAKRQQNLSKHGLDFLDADLVLESPYRLEVDSERSGERRRQAFAYVFEVLTRCAASSAVQGGEG